MSDEDTKVGDDTSVEDTASDSASTEDTEADSSNGNEAVDTADDKTDAPKSDDLAKNYKIRAEKAERELKEIKAKSTSEKPARPAKDDDKGFDKRLQDALDKRDLAEMEYPDDIKKAIKRVSELDGIPVKKAVNDPTVAARIESWKKQQESEDAAISRNNKSGGKVKFDPETPPDVDFSTPEGRKAYDEWQEKAIAHELENKG